jgi:hypothetical protein
MGEWMMPLSIRAMLATAWIAYLVFVHQEMDGVVMAIGLGEVAGLTKLAGLVRGLFGGGGGKKQRQMSEQYMQQQMDLMQKLIPQLAQQMEMDRTLNMRTRLLTDPGLAPMFQAQFPGQASQISRMAAAGRPLKTGRVDLAWGLLPKAARERSSEAETARQQGEQADLLGKGRPEDQRMIQQLQQSLRDMEFERDQSMSMWDPV